MKIILISVMVAIMLLGCKPKKEIVITSNNQIIAESDEELTQTEIEEIPIIIKEENIISAEKLEPVLPEEKYFVIMGSFKVFSNAQKFQEQLRTEGFESQILRNENGLYRLSVYAYKEINEARGKIYFIRKNYPKYNDVWLLKKLT